VPAQQKVKISIVVDTSVLQAAGGPDRPNPVSKNCAEALEIIRENLFLACTRDLFKEWLSHMDQGRLSHFSSEWLAAMQSAGRLRFVPRLPDLSSRLELCLKNKVDPSVKIKDIHLVESAVASDGRVLSRDRKARGHFRTCCGTVPELHDILWANPKDKDTLQWLRDGAPDRQDLRLSVG